jgi:saccharopine dehydrogenase (NAD+, L-lysine forming)
MPSNINVGIRREDINKWERRAPLIPAHVREIVKAGSFGIYIQPSTIRVFGDDDYAREGARVQEDLCPCRVVLALKEIPLSLFEKDKVYVFFSHTIKGQAHNMPMLKRMMECGCSLIDYEKVEDDKGRRVLFFGSYAGEAGMIDSLWALGRRLKEEGLDTPFLRLSQTYRYKSLVEAKENVAEVGKMLSRKGLPASLSPFVCGFLGYGHVSQGAQEIFGLLPSEEIRPEDLPKVFRPGAPAARGLYKLVFHEADMVKPIDHGRPFDLQDYYSHPADYAPVVDSYVPYLTMLINGIFWTPKFPKFVTKPFLRKLYGGPEAPRLKVIGDITCDIDGSIESTIRATDSENPVYLYDPMTDKAETGFAGRGPAVMAVYNLPAELPLESSTFFSGRLKDYVPAIAGADFRGDFDACALPPEVKKAVILYRGKLTPAYEYLGRFIA